MAQLLTGRPEAKRQRAGLLSPLLARFSKRQA